MKSTLKFAACILLTGVLFFTSCQKELSCENCGSNPLTGGTNKPPIANAGPDQTIILPKDSIVLDGSLSSDPDGTIISYHWTRISGPFSANILKTDSSKTLVNGLVMGVYKFELKVIDDKGASAKDTVQIIVNDPSQPNRPPVANAGADQTITFPANTVTLDGSASTDPDNNITSYAWTKISGPSSFNIANASTAQTQITNLVEGTYQFELKVTDAGVLFSKDTVQVIVMSQAPACTSCKIVFVSSRDGNEEIYSCNADGTNIQRLTNNGGSDVQPAWPPDGTLIAFISDRTGNPELYIMNADGSNVIRKTFSGYSQDPTWSPDGTKIAYSALSNGSSNIWVTGASSGSTPILLFDEPGRDEHPAWSPDGTKIALASDWAAYDFVYDIYTINANGTGFTALTGINIFDQFDYLYPSWSPSGTKLAMAISETIGTNQYNTQVGVINADGSGLTPIISGAAAWTKTSWSGDGSKIAYTSLSGSRRDVSWVSANGAFGGTIVTDGWDANWQH